MTGCGFDLSTLRDCIGIFEVHLGTQNINNPTETNYNTAIALDQAIHPYFNSLTLSNLRMTCSRRTNGHRSVRRENHHNQPSQADKTFNGEQAVMTSVGEILPTSTPI
ncbi:uncharacterized protein LOC132205259 [Neocloeon triangulifer]|uniref:uncharacterized protein LOC132205259 n=1 Tax=Neocloeon triangulifer TaxID=2078957 RepID=UPI00286F742B|nr:uncharacterized protein LOC132205259 [Neocloeon triangulifer]